MTACLRTYCYRACIKIDKVAMSSLVANSHLGGVHRLWERYHQVSESQLQGLFLYPTLKTRSDVEKLVESVVLSPGRGHAL